MLEYLKIIGIPTAVSGILFFILKNYFKKKIDSSFAKKLEDHKHDLQIASEEARFDFQRKIEDFSLYTNKKHEKYSQLYEKILASYGKVNSLYGFRTELTYEEFNKADIRRVMEEDNFPEGKIDEVFHAWDTEGKPSAIKKMKIFKRLIEFQKANNSIQKARKEFRLSKLYFSEELANKIENYFTKLITAETHYEENYDFRTGKLRGNKDLIDTANNAKKEAEKLRAQITKQMKKELSIGYYSFAG